MASPLPSPASGASIVRLDPAADHLLARNAVVEKVAGGFVFTEGPMWREGRLWFSDEEADRIYALTAHGERSVLVDYSKGALAAPNGEKRGPNGMATAPDGSVVLMRQYARDVLHLTEDSSGVHSSPWFHSYNGKRLNSPNDVVFAHDGSFYFTDPPFGLKLRDKDPAKQLPFNAVFHVTGPRSAPVLTPVVTTLTLPNGLALSPDGRTLYVGNSGPDMRVMRYDVQADGSVKNERLVIRFSKEDGKGVPDGMKLDSLGNIWTTAPGGVRILTPEGKQIALIRLPEVPANVAWGGEDGHTLYMTARTGIYRVHTLVRGNLPLYRK